MNIILQMALAYLQKHPEVVEQLIEQLFKALLAQLAAANAPKA